MILFLGEKFVYKSPETANMTNTIAIKEKGIFLDVI
jgi:hypothetical protein